MVTGRGPRAARLRFTHERSRNRLKNQGLSPRTLPIRRSTDPPIRNFRQLKRGASGVDWNHVVGMTMRRRMLILVAVAGCLMVACAMGVIAFVGMTSLAGM